MKEKTVVTLVTTLTVLTVDRNLSIEHICTWKQNFTGFMNILTIYYNVKWYTANSETLPCGEVWSEGSATDGCTPFSFSMIDIN